MLGALTICIEVSGDFYKLNLQSQYQYLDDKLFLMISESGLLDDNKKMSPLPLLGVPSWFEGNKQKTFYDNTQYFRPKRHR